MLHCANRLTGQNIKYLHSSGWQLEELYRRLSTQLDRVRNAQFSIEDSRRQVCLAVLAEDLEVLLEQCENQMYFTDNCVSNTSDMLLLESLSQTVLEELFSVLPQIS